MAMGQTEPGQWPGSVDMGIVGETSLKVLVRQAAGVIVPARHRWAMDQGTPVPRFG